MNKVDNFEIDWLYFEDSVLIRVLKLEGGKVLFSANDVCLNALGVVSSHNLTKGVDDRSKTSAVVTFVEDYNPQRYVFLDMYGLMDVVYRARKSDVNRLDFIKWAEKQGAR